MPNHTHIRQYVLSDWRKPFTCLICGETIDPTKKPWTTLKYNLDDRGLPNAFKTKPPKDGKK